MTATSIQGFEVAAQDRPATTKAIYKVVGVRSGDVLNIRSLPDGFAPVIASLQPGTTGLTRSGRTIQNTDTFWVEVRHGGVSGWVAARFLAPDTTPPPTVTPTVTAVALGGPAWQPQVKAEAVDAAQTAALPQRAALVIGNGRYPIDSSLSQLLQPQNNGRDLSAALKARGYDVATLIDADLVELRRGLMDFKARTTAAEIGLIYFGGHALQMGGETYLLPISSRIKKSEDLKRHALPLSELVGAFGTGTPKQAFVVIDASRDNRLHDRLAELARKAGAVDQVPAKGLATPRSRPGMTIVYASEPGRIALDGTGRNSALVQPLLDGLAKPDPNIASLLSSLRESVSRATGNRQVPWFEETSPDVRPAVAKAPTSRGKAAVPGSVNR